MAFDSTSEIRHAKAAVDLQGQSRRCKQDQMAVQSTCCSHSLRIMRIERPMLSKEHVKL